MELGAIASTCGTTEDTLNNNNSSLSIGSIVFHSKILRTKSKRSLKKWKLVIIVCLSNNKCKPFDNKLLFSTAQRHENKKHSIGGKTSDNWYDLDTRNDSLLSAVFVRYFQKYFLNAIQLYKTFVFTIYVCVRRKSMLFSNCIRLFINQCFGCWKQILLNA